MANWASTSYAIEGPKEVLEKIEQAIFHHDVEVGSSKDWEGNVLSALGITWIRRTQSGQGKYMRGFINGEPWYDFGTGALRFDAEEAWGVTDFNEVLEENLPVKVYYVVEEPDCEVYATNDQEGKYFPDRFYVDTCIDSNYQQEYFKTKEAVYKWLSEITEGRVKCEKDVDEFNDGYKDSDAADENYIYVHEFNVIE